MKKKIVFALSLILLIFFIGGLFIIFTIETSRSKFNKLVKLHQVQILRENLLLNLERVQGDIYLRGTRFARDDASLVNNTAVLESAINNCFSCHHPENLNNKLVKAKEMINDYKARINKFLTSKDGRTDIERMENEAIELGNNLLDMFNEIVSTANLHLRARTIEVFEYTNTIEMILYVSMLAGLLTAFLIAFRFERHLMKPVGALLKGTENFSKGNLEYRIPEDMPRELSIIAASLNRMASELKENIEKMKMAEQMQIIGEVAAGLAHEIKNPLAGIKGAIEVFLKELNLTNEDRAVFEEILFQVKKLDVMTRSFLEYARPPSPQFVPSNVNDIINNTISFITKHNLHKNIPKVEVIKELDEFMPVINADPMQMQQVFLNLIINAMDAMPGGGKLRFKTAHNNSSVEIEVSDTGYGLDSETINKIFQPFFTTKTRGLGIGLSISKRLIEQHGGGITVESGKTGTIFKITLPSHCP